MASRNSTCRPHNYTELAVPTVRNCTEPAHSTAHLTGNYMERGRFRPDQTHNSRAVARAKGADSGTTRNSCSPNHTTSVQFRALNLALSRIQETEARLEPGARLLDHGQAA